jgi:hypothetical protein
MVQSSLLQPNRPTFVGCSSLEETLSGSATPKYNYSYQGTKDSSSPFNSTSVSFQGKFTGKAVKNASIEES